ncbi:MAG: hypothetical protein K0R80_1745 [Clostridia bacterium]|jgi:hypothetical protein|nr:hypothetical protein [Clostridia bacterium]
MGFEQVVFKFLGRLSREDLLVLLLLVFLIFENRCDRNFKIILLVIFLSGLEQGVFGR